MFQSWHILLVNGMIISVTIEWYLDRTPENANHTKKKSFEDTEVYEAWNNDKGIVAARNQPRLLEKVK